MALEGPSQPKHTVQPVKVYQGVNAVALIIDRLFGEEGIVIALPQQDLYLCCINSGLQNLFGAKSLKDENGTQGTSA